MNAPKIPLPLWAVLGSLGLHAALAAGTVLGTVPRLPFVDPPVSEVELGADEGDVPVPVTPVTAEPANAPESAAPRPVAAAPAEETPHAEESAAPETAAPEAVRLPDDETGEDEPGVVLPPSPETAAAKDAQGDTAPDDGPPDQPSSAPLAEDPMLAWRSLRASGSGLGAHVPVDARLAVWVDMAALRRSPLHGEVAATLRVLAGLYELCGWAGIDLVEDVDELVVASPNPYAPGQLYVVAKLKGAENAEARLAGLGEAARRVEVAPGVWAFTPAAAEHAPYVLAAVGTDVLAAFPARRAGKLLEPGPGPASRPAPAGGKFTGLLRGEGAPPRRADAPEILLAAVGVDRLLPMIAWGPSFAPAPESLRVSVDVVVGAEIHAEMHFAREADAAAARDAWTKVLDDLRGTLLLRIIGVTPLLDRIDVFASGADLRGTLELGPDEAVRVLRAIRPLLVGEPE